ncbi:hypothetical protein SDC9_135146 [bioreactor metagenome]|uniref:Calcineurin-like phosphoesterase domain-containing protein n=1 Tax=bioreactor metagenome TaxID=1076179 RepID=A0A645DFP8_9ZZZZ|nr:metallophosphoesterase [Oscillospiraceae bacterium]
MSLFVLSDPHLSLSGEKPMDVFGGMWSNYTEKLSENWNRTVSASDTVIIPGDISWAMTASEALEDFKYIDFLPGKKILMRGNHDYWWATLSKLNNFCSENGFESISFLHNNAMRIENFIICGTRGWIWEDKMSDDDTAILRRETLRFQISLSEAKKLFSSASSENTGSHIEKIAFFHYPVVTGAEKRNPLVDQIKEAGITRVYCGHLHGPSFTNAGLNPYLSCEGISFYLCSADYLRFEPLLIKPAYNKNLLI